MTKVFPVLKNFNLPNLVSSLAVFIGVLSFYLALNNQLTAAFTLFPLAILCDRFDGLIARKLGQSSSFGVALDSLADCFNYCFLPAVFTYFIGFNSFAESIILMLFILAGLWRLAYFNLKFGNPSADKSVFQGMPTPYAAALLVIYISGLHILRVTDYTYFLSVFLIVMALLEISTVSIRKNGLLTRLLFIFTPIAICLLWL